MRTKRYLLLQTILQFNILLKLSVCQYCTSFQIPLITTLSSYSRRQVLETTITSPLSVMSKLSPSSLDAKSTVMSSPVESSDLLQRNIRWGIIGLGDVCQVKSGPAFYKCQGSSLVAVMRRTPDKAREYAARVPGGNCVGYESIDEFLNHDGLDAVYVSTRPGTHLEICKLVAQAGKHVYVEKPVGRCAEETEEIQKIFKDAGLKFYTAYISRAYDRTQMVCKLLTEGFIGSSIQKVTYTLIGSGGARDMDADLPWRLNATESGGGLIMDVGCHVLDRIDYLCGPLVNVEGHAENRHSPEVSVEDYVRLSAGLQPSSWSTLPVEGDATVECTWNFATQEEAPLDELEIVGPKGSLRMAGMSPNGPIRIFDGNNQMQREIEFEMPQHTAQKLIQEVTNDLRGMKESERELQSSVLSFGKNAIRTQKVIDTALASY